jgi:predicted enzyme related to lactoylglutathione lyase
MLWEGFEVNVKFCSSVLLVKDIKLSRQFYEEFLNQKVEIDYGTNVGFVGGFAIWQKEGAYKNIFGNTHIRVTSENKEHELELYFETEYIDEIYERLLHNNTEMLHEMFEQPWGQRGFRVYDPDRYIVEIGEPMDSVIKRFFNSGMTVEEVSKIAHTPLEVVKKIVALM